MFNFFKSRSEKVAYIVPSMGTLNLEDENGNVLATSSSNKELRTWAQMNGYVCHSETDITPFPS